jgi:hypothetical protein
VCLSQFADDLSDKDRVFGGDGGDGGDLNAEAKKRNLKKYPTPFGLN